MDEIESAERREWNDALALAYADLGPAELAARTRKAEGWLSVAPNSAALATALGRLCAAQELWGKAEQYLERALAIEETPLAWETLGDCHAGTGDAAMASTCYANALRVARGEPTAAGARALRGPAGAVDTRAIAFEERTEHGVPRLPGVKSG
jgi:HemY protein